MTTLATALPLGPGALAVLSIDALLRRLPADVRATIAWTQKPIREAVRELRRGKLTDEALGKAARQTWPAMQAFTLAFWKSVAQDRGAWGKTLSAELQQDRERLEQFVEDEDSRETIEWLFSFTEEMLLRLLPLIGPGFYDAIPEEAWSKAPEDPDLLPLLTGSIALTAALDAANEGQDRERARDLLDIAFLELSRARDYFQRFGLWISPFPGETPEVRTARTLRYAERARTALTAEDVGAFEAARLRALR
jgi:hypothetical protein